jgi:ribonuclease HIII
MNIMILILGGLILILDIYVMILDKKIRKLQSSIKDIAELNVKNLDNSKKLIELSKGVNNNAEKVILYNSNLAKINQEIVQNVKILTDCFGKVEE